MFDAVEDRWSWAAPEFGLAALSTILAAVILAVSVRQAVFASSNDPLVFLLVSQQLTVAFVFLGIGYLLGRRFLPGRSESVVAASEHPGVWKAIQLVLAGLFAVVGVLMLTSIPRLVTQSYHFGAIKDLAVAVVLFGVAYVLSRPFIPANWTA